MLKRYYLNVNANYIRKKYNVDLPSFQLSIEEKFFDDIITPGHKAPVIIKGSCSIIRWGLVFPFSNSLLHSAKIESISKKPAFKNSFLKRRCLIPASSLFLSINKKMECKISFKNSFSLAGIYDICSNKNEPHFAIVTKDQNIPVLTNNSNISTPLILDKEKEKLWLNPNSKISQLKNIAQEEIEDTNIEILN